MALLDSVKNYLRIDEDMTDDDEQISGLIIAAELYISNATGKIYDETNELMNLCLKLVVAHWYTDRSNTGKSETEYPHSITALLNHIELSSAYTSKGDQP